MNNEERMEQISAVQAKYAEELMNYPNVVGVGIGMRQKDGEYTDELCLVVMVSEKLPQAQLEPSAILPEQIEDIPIDVQEMGEFSA